jgi:hypothetical protein
VPLRVLPNVEDPIHRRQLHPLAPEVGVRLDADRLGDLISRPPRFGQTRGLRRVFHPAVDEKRAQVGVVAVPGLLADGLALHCHAFHLPALARHPPDRLGPEPDPVRRYARVVVQVEPTCFEGISLARRSRRIR